MSKAEIEQALYGNKRSKYGVDLSVKGKEDRTWDGIVFDSKREMEVYRDWIKPNISAGIFKNLQFQVKFALHVVNPGGFQVKVGVYKADFTVLTRENKLAVIEAKGMRTPLYKLKKKMFESEYGITITEV